MKKASAPTLREWLDMFGQESCAGCCYNNAYKAKCSYKKGYCARFDEFKGKKNQQPKQLRIFE